MRVQVGIFLHLPGRQSGTALLGCLPSLYSNTNACFGFADVAQRVVHLPLSCCPKGNKP
jgi:hypothetical protein